MQSELDDFAAFYIKKHQGHKIEWSHALGTVSLRAQFAAGQKELSVSLHQAVVLLLFNDMVEIPFSDVKLHTGFGTSKSPVWISASSYIFSPRVMPFFYYSTRSFRGCGSAMHAPELGLREEKSAKKTPRWKRRER
jgi:hypothetical protein